MADSPQHIHCSIDNCHYWGAGNTCSASEILVTSDAMSDTLSDRIDAPLAAQVAKTPVQKCKESCCKTFVPKDAYQAREDGVRRRS
jgi:hypothetical protein